MASRTTGWCTAHRPTFSAVPRFQRPAVVNCEIVAHSSLFVVAGMPWSSQSLSASDDCITWPACRSDSQLTRVAVRGSCFKWEPPTVTHSCVDGPAATSHAHVEPLSACFLVTFVVSLLCLLQSDLVCCCPSCSWIGFCPLCAAHVTTRTDVVASSPRAASRSVILSH